MSCVANTDLVTPAAARRQSAVVVEARRLLGALYASTPTMDDFSLQKAGNPRAAASGTIMAATGSR